MHVLQELVIVLLCVCNAMSTLFNVYITVVCPRGFLRILFFALGLKSLCTTDVDPIAVLHYGDKNL